MINTIKSTALLGDQPDQRSPRKDSKRESGAGSTAKVSTAQPDIRLVIEEDRDRGGLIYKLIDRASGQVVSEISRDELLKMGSDPFYTAGKVIDTKA